MIKPVRDHVLISICAPEKESKTKSGLILTGGATEQKQTIATVLAVGEGRTLENGEILKSIVSPGDEIIFYDYAGVVVYPKDIGADRIFLLIKQNDIIAIVTPD